MSGKTSSSAKGGRPTQYRRRQQAGQRQSQCLPAEPEKVISKKSETPPGGKRGFAVDRMDKERRELVTTAEKMAKSMPEDKTERHR
jgi:hypothetical protein